MTERHPRPPAGLRPGKAGIAPPGGTPDPDRLEQARRVLREGAAALGLRLTEAQLHCFDRFAALLRAGKQEFSLTALTDPVDVATKHFLDSLSILNVLPDETSRLVDVGTGAGFPGLPLKLVRPTLEVTLLEATAKKALWLQSAIAALEVRGATALAGRSEEVARLPEHRGRYDAAVARAVAPLPVLCELCLPFVRPAGTFVALKSGTGAAVEVPQASHVLSLLGAELVDVHPLALPGLPNRVLVVIRQVQPVPDAYPRRAGMPAKRPL